MPSGRSVTQLHPTLGDPMDCRPPGSSVPRILQARILEWVVISFCRGSSWLRDRNFKVYSYIFGSKTWSIFFLSWVWLFSVKITNRIITGHCPRPTGNMYDFCNTITILHSKIQKILTSTAHLAPRFLNNRLWVYSFKINMVPSGQPLPTPPSATWSSFLPDTRVLTIILCYRSPPPGLGVLFPPNGISLCHPPSFFFFFFKVLKRIFIFCFLLW